MQESLFSSQSDPNGYEQYELGNAWIREYSSVLSTEQSVALLSRLLKLIPWRQESLWIAGQRRPVPRLQCWMGEACYGYSGLQLDPVPWQEDVLELKLRIESLTGCQFNSVLLNYYRNGQDSVAWHADDEEELGSDPHIASFSLGAERPFDFRPKPGNAGNKFRLLLKNGSLILMGSGVQGNWLHQLPKVRGLDQARINLTFRNINSEFLLNA